MSWQDAIVDAHQRMAQVSGEAWRGTNDYFDVAPIGTRTFTGRVPQVRYWVSSVDEGSRSLSDMYGAQGIAATPWILTVRCRVVGRTVEETITESMCVQTMLSECDVTPGKFSRFTWENNNADTFTVERGNYALSFEFPMTIALTQGWQWRSSVVIEDHAEDSYTLVDAIPTTPVISGSTPPV